MSFDVDVGHYSHPGPRPGNEDFAAAMHPPPQDAARGLIIRAYDAKNNSATARGDAPTAR